MVDVESTPTFAKKFAITFVAHLGLLFLAAMVGKAVGTLWKTNDVEVIRSSVRVDIVGMPKFTIQELKEMEKSAVELPKEPEAVKAPDKVEAKPEAPDVINKDDLVIQEAAKEKEKKKTSFLNALSDYAKKDVKKETRKGEKNGAADENIKALVLEGNRLSQGTALTGDYSDEVATEMSAYADKLLGTIRPNWKLPSYLKDANLKCRVRIYLSATGAVLKKELLESSGNPEYDAKAMRAIEDTKFPAPSEAVAKRLTNSGIILGFPL